MRHLTIFASFALFACSEGNNLPPHNVSQESLGSDRYRIQVDVSQELSKSECEELLDKYRFHAGVDGQVLVRKPSAKLGGKKLPWCVDNLDGEDVRFNDFYFD